MHESPSNNLAFEITPPRNAQIMAFHVRHRLVRSGDVIADDCKTPDTTTVERRLDIVVEQKRYRGGQLICVKVLQSFHVLYNILQEADGTKEITLIDSREICVV